MGSSNDDTLYGKAGRDVLRGRGGDDILHGGRGADELHGGAGRDELHGGRGKDRLRGGSGRDSLWGGRGDDLLRGGEDGDDLEGGEGDDDIYGDNGHDWVDGGPGNDYLSGGENSDYLNGGEGDDVLHGGGDESDSGADSANKLDGGKGNDIYVFQPGDGNALLLNFTPGKDLIDLTAFRGIASFQDLEATNDDRVWCTDHGKVWCIDLTTHGGGYIRVPYMELFTDELVASDFIFWRLDYRSALGSKVATVTGHSRPYFGKRETTHVDSISCSRWHTAFRFRVGCDTQHGDSSRVPCGHNARPYRL